MIHVKEGTITDVNDEPMMLVSVATFNKMCDAMAEMAKALGAPPRVISEGTAKTARFLSTTPPDGWKWEVLEDGMPYQVPVFKPTGDEPMMGENR